MDKTTKKRRSYNTDVVRALSEEYGVSEYFVRQSILNREIVDYRAYHKIIKQKPFTIKNKMLALAFTVVEGTADVTINSITITYPVGDVRGATFDGKIGSKVFKPNITITPIGDAKVLLTGIKKD